MWQQKGGRPSWGQAPFLIPNRSTGQALITALTRAKGGQQSLASGPAEFFHAVPSPGTVSSVLDVAGATERSRGLQMTQGRSATQPGPLLAALGVGRSCTCAALV